MGMPWIKLYTEILDEPKLGRLSDALKWRFVQLCLLAGECDAEGYLVSGTEAMPEDDIAWRLRLDVNELQKSLAELEGVGLVELDRDGDIWFVKNFSKRQGRSQSEKRKAWRERKQRQRDNETDVTEESRVTPGPRVEQSRTEGEQSREEAEAERDINPADPQRSSKVHAVLEGYGVEEPSLSKLAASHWVNCAYVQEWWAYIDTWDIATSHKVGALVKRLKARRKVPPEHGKGAGGEYEGLVRT